MAFSSAPPGTRAVLPDSHRATFAFKDFLNDEPAEPALKSAAAVDLGPLVSNVVADAARPLPPLNLTLSLAPLLPQSPEPPANDALPQQDAQEQSPIPTGSALKAPSPMVPIGFVLAISNNAKPAAGSAPMAYSVKAPAILTASSSVASAKPTISRPGQPLPAAQTPPQTREAEIGFVLQNASAQQPLPSIPLNETPASALDKAATDARADVEPVVPLAPVTDHNAPAQKRMQTPAAAAAITKHRDQIEAIAPAVFSPQAEAPDTKQAEAGAIKHDKPDVEPNSGIAHVTERPATSQLAFGARITPSSEAAAPTPEASDRQPAIALNGEPEKEIAKPRPSAEPIAAAPVSSSFAAHTEASAIAPNVSVERAPASRAPQTVAQPAHAPEPSLPEPPITPASQPVRDLSFRIASAAGQEKVDVKVTEVAGDIRVAVRSSDPQLTASLQQNLGTLTGKLESRGMPTEVWKPAAQQQSFGDDGSQGRRGQQQDPKHPPPQRNKPDWLREIDSDLDTLR